MAAPEDSMGVGGEEVRVLEISDPVWHDDAPEGVRRPPLLCRLRLRHQWTRVALDSHHAYVACRRCQRLPARTIFEAPLP